MTALVLHIVSGYERRLVGVFSTPEKAAEYQRLHPAEDEGNIARYDEPEAVEVDAGCK